MGPWRIFFALTIAAVLLFVSSAFVAETEWEHVAARASHNQKVYQIAIIGCGASGTMAAKRAVLNNRDTLLFLGAKQEQRCSRGKWVRAIDNIPGLSRYKRPILEMRDETLQELRAGPFCNQLTVIEDSVQSIEQGRGCFELRDRSGATYHAKYVILATGIMDEQPHIGGSIRPVLTYANKQSILYCTLCDGHRSLGKKTVVIGHSDSAASVAVTLSERYRLTSVTILTNGKEPTFSQELKQGLQEQKIHVVDKRIQEVIGCKDPSSGNEKQLVGFRLSTGEVIDSEVAFIALGIRPNNQLAVQLGARVDEEGLVITDAFGESSVPNLFVIGDLRADSTKQIYTAWQHAVETVQAIERSLSDHPASCSCGLSSSCPSEG